jgi:hypothetical protein
MSLISVVNKFWFFYDEGNLRTFPQNKCRYTECRYAESRGTLEVG